MRIAKLNSLNMVENTIQTPARGESSIQGAARAIREASQQSLSRARWEERVVVSRRLAEAALEAADKARLGIADSSDS